jgi:hypothetical protein
VAGFYFGEQSRLASSRAMKTQLPETQPLPLSLREILAFKAIAPSYEKLPKRLALFKAETSTPTPGIEVTWS